MTGCANMSRAGATQMASVQGTVARTDALALLALDAGSTCVGPFRAASGQRRAGWPVRSIEGMTMNDQQNTAEFADCNWDWEAELRKITSNHNVIVLPMVEPDRDGSTNDAAIAQS